MKHYHTVTVECVGDEYIVFGANNQTADIEHVESVTLEGTAAGVNVPDGGQVRFESADSHLTIDVQDFTDDYGYMEAQINLEEKDKS